MDYQEIIVYVLLILAIGYFVKKSFGKKKNKNGGGSCGSGNCGCS